MRITVPLTGILLLLTVYIATACGRGVAPAPANPATPASSTTGDSRPSWEKEWESVQQAARKEGKLTIYTAIGPEVRDVLIKGFKEKFGLDLDIVIGRSTENMVKLNRERGAGLYQVDLWMSGTGSATEILAPQGILDPFDNLLILPEALDKKAWWEGDLPWVDKGHYQLAFLASPKVPISFNTDLVKPGEVTSYRDLLNPKWKGKIVMEDPSTLGSGNAWATAVATAILDKDYLRKLGAQEPVIGRDSRLLAEWVARGKYPVGLAIKGEEIIRFKKSGAPTQLVTPSEGTYVTGSAGCLSVVNKAPHPNAVKLFVNWALTRDGGTILSRAHGYQSARVDVATDFLEPENIRQSGMKYFNQDKHEYSSQKIPMQDMAKEIFNIK
ncbi:MAG: extracellular solute-binding protein [Chloroflexi bacterium]|nr:extracellular solute-binding protein [Chloroflexota bacterium]